MQFLKRGLMAAGALALAVTLLNLAAPKRVHAAVAALVQVANTIANPAITQDTSKAAAQIVNLECLAVTTAYPCVARSTAAYVVPDGQSLVITSIEVSSAAGGSGIQEVLVGGADLPGGYLYQDLRVSNVLTTQFVYPSGIVYAAGKSVYVMSNVSTNQTVFMSGYLTAN
jgi:hypothetical protein